MPYLDRLSENFVNQYKDHRIPWGQLGYVTYKRTYARKIEGDGTEEWFQTIERCVNSVLGLGKFTREEAEFLYDSVLNLKCNFSGRALWQLGTKTMEKVGGDSIQNCWVTCVNDPVKPFCFVFNELMLGGGVGYNIQKENVYEMPKVKYGVKVSRKDDKDVNFIVPDNREGWVELLHRVLEAFFFTGKDFTYSTICVRPKGALIKSFGGIASGPEDLCVGITQICMILSQRVGKKLRPIDCLDIMNIIGSIVVSGNVRRSAQLALGDVDDSAFLSAKDWSKHRLPSWRDKSNNSVACSHIADLPEYFWNGYKGEGEAYGLVNLNNLRRYGRLADGLDYRPDRRVVGVNPCLSGDTLVYVADGRGNVPIRQLANEGKDIPVFCFNDEGKIAVRTMRNPRLTGTKEKIVKLTLEEGFVLRVSQNHKFLTNNGDYKETKDLSVGDGLKMVTRYKSSIDEVLTREHRSGRSDYWWIATGFKSNKSEHRIMAEFKYGRPLVNGDVVHHLDKDGTNNRFENIEVMDKSCHDRMHVKCMLGDNNPMRRGQTEWSKEKWDSYGANMSVSVRGDKNGRFCGETNDDLRDHAIMLTKILGRRYSWEEWVSYAKENGLPMNLSKWRRDHLGGIIGLAKWAASQCGYGNLDIDPRTTRFYQKVLSEGYDAVIVDRTVMVKKSCERCGQFFLVDAKRREVGFCSVRCHRSWEKTRKFKGLEQAQILNHKILKIEFDGEEEVYNGTVDEYHNFFVGGFEGKTRSDKPKFLYVNNLQCGEIGLEGSSEDGSGEACNLAEIFLPNISDVAEFKKVGEIMYKVVKSISCMKFLYDGTNEIVQRNHRLGIGVTGFMQSKYINDAKAFDDVYKHIEKADKEYSKELGVSRSIKLTTVKPSGTSSLLPQVTPGVHPAYSPFYIRRIRMAANDPLVPLCEKHGYKVEPLLQIDGSRNMDTMVVEFPVAVPKGTICAKDLTAIQQIEHQKFLQTHWSDNAVSVSVYFKKEELPQIKEWLTKNYDDSVKTISFLLHSGHGFAQAPYEEISEQDFKSRSSKTKPITKIDDKEVRGLIDAQECAGGSCPIK